MSRWAYRTPGVAVLLVAPVALAAEPQPRPTGQADVPPRSISRSEPRPSGSGPVQAEPRPSGSGPRAPAREIVQQGNEHYAAGRYAEALRCYEEAQTAADARQRAEILHNQAAAHFKLGDTESARDLWVRLKESPDPAFEARTRYNLGNCDYAEALAAAGQQDVRGALQRLAASAEQYRSALRLDPVLADARANLELAELLKRQLEQQPESPESQNSERQGESDQRQEQNQSATQPSSQPDQSEQRPEPQSSPDKTPEESESSPQEPNQPSEGQPSPESDAEQQPQTPPPSESESEPGKEGEAQESPGEESRPIEMTREQAERLLQMVRDAERARREALARQQAARQEPVDRDW